MTATPKTTPNQTLHRLIGVLLICWALLQLFYFVEITIAVYNPPMSRLRLGSNYLLGLSWPQFLWQLRMYSIIPILCIFTAIALFKGKKRGWVMALPIVISLIISCFLGLLIRHFPSHIIRFEAQQIKYLVMMLAAIAALVILVIPAFWRGFQVKLVDFMLMIILLCCLLLLDPIVQLYL